MLITVLIIIPSLTILLTGCWDSIDIEDRAYVIALPLTSTLNFLKASK